MAYNKKIVAAKLAELATIYDYPIKDFPRSVNAEGSAKACRDYTKAARPGLIMVERMRALSKGSANKSVYR